MKYWLPFTTLMLTTVILQAQVPYGGTNFQPYYPGAVTQPYVPQAYYPQPYFGQSSYALNQLSITETNDEIGVLSRQVEQLNGQVVHLQAQLASVQNQQTPAPIESAVSQPPVPSTPVALVFKNGRLIEAQGYAVVGRTLWIFNPSGSERVALSQLNVSATKTENLRRGIHFPDLGS